MTPSSPPIVLNVGKMMSPDNDWFLYRLCLSDQDTEGWLWINVNKWVGTTYSKWKTSVALWLDLEDSFSYEDNMDSTLGPYREKNGAQIIQI